MLHRIEGRIRLDLSAGPVELKEGESLYLDGSEPHVIRGVQDASLLFTLLFDAGDPCHGGWSGSDAAVRLERSLRRLAG